MTYATPKEIAAALIAEMKESGHTLWIDPQTHADQHEFIAEMILERKERIARRKRIEEKIAGSLGLTAIGFSITLLGAGFLEWVRNKA